MDRATSAWANRWSVVQNTVPTNVSLNAIHGVSASSIWAVGGYGTILHYDGASWRAQGSGVVAGLSAVWAASTTQAWAAGFTMTVLKYDGTVWSPDPVSGAGNDLVYSLWGRAANDVRAVSGTGPMLHYDGTTWTPASVSTTALYALWGIAGEWWAAGGDVLHQQGSSNWQVVAGFPSHKGVALNGVGGSGPGDVWITGGNSLWHYDGNSWTSRQDPALLALKQADILSSVWSNGPNDAWAVGAGGLLLHFDGAAWTRVPSPATATLYGVWGSSATDVWAVGEGATLIHGVFQP